SCGAFESLEAARSGRRTEPWLETRLLPTLTRSYPCRFTLITRTASCSRHLPWLRCRLPARLKLVRFPPHSPLPIAALPSMSLSQTLHSLDRDVFYVADPISSIQLCAADTAASTDWLSSCIVSGL